MIILNKSQKESLKKLITFMNDYQNKFFILKGSAGTGKTTVISQLLKEERFKNLKIAFSATTNKAVSVLKEFTKTTNNKYAFLTIHKLLNIKRKIDKDGKEVFNIIEDNKKLIKSLSIYYYDIIIIDECSMLSNEIICTLFKLKNFKGKIIFIGDSAQLPPVNEKTYLFEDENILSYELNEIMRYKGEIVNLANKVRDLVFDENTKIKFNKYRCDNIKISKKFDIWFSSYIDNLKNNFDENLDNLPICLTYTNKQTDYINNQVRKVIFEENNKRFVKNDIIIFNNYYYLKKNKVSYYTSQKTKIIDSEETYLEINYSNPIDDEVKNDLILNKFDKIFNSVKLKVWKLKMLSGDIIYLIHEDIKDDYNELIESLKIKIIKFRKFLNKITGKCSDKLMETTWSYLYDTYIDIFADISYGYCITTHKSQGSTFKDVYVDMNNIILKNKNQIESYRCLYTAITRTSEKLNILI
jgi:ATP-dependent exoDNAse (exonuclease V) alpha subunit